jgi:hypothetical protein
MIMPGANAFWKEAPFATPPMLVLAEAPTTNETGTLTYWGVVFVDWIMIVARYAPLACPLAEAFRAT